METSTSTSSSRSSSKSTATLSSASSKKSAASSSASTVAALQARNASVAVENAVAAISEPSFLSKNKGFFIFLGVVGLIVALNFIPSNRSQPKKSEDTTFSYKQLVRTLYTPGTDAVGTPTDFENTNVTGRLRDGHDVDFENAVSVVVAHSNADLQKPGIVHLMSAPDVTRPVVLLMNTHESDVAPHEHYSVRKNGDVFMYIPKEQ